MIKRVRNRGLLPNLEEEGALSQEILISTTEKHGVPVGSRLYSHHTLASVRRMSFYQPFQITEDSLDFILNSTYIHSRERFADKQDLYIQPETIGCETGRRIRNTTDIYPTVVVPLGHPLTFGGIRERRSPYCMKLMNSGVHSSQTNPGFSRKASGGAIFFY